MNWIIGPQLIGVIILIVGLMSARFPPKKINPMYGYRTASSMKNQQTWNEANRFSARYMIKLGLILLMIGLLVSALFSTGIISTNLMNLLRPVLLIGGSITMAVILIVATEKHLSKTFDDKTE